MAQPSSARGLAETETKTGTRTGTPPLLSVVVIAKNEAHCIGACLDAVGFADEIIVLDSGSTDDTLAIAAAHGARVHGSADWPGFGPQKNRAIALASGQWILSLDADEIVMPELADAIRHAVAPGAERGIAGYWIKRRSLYCGQLIRHGDWRNDRVLRLFRRDAGRFTDDLVHERVICDGRTATLAGYLRHDSMTSFAELREKTERYARLGAAKLRARGKGGLFSACTHAAWNWLRGYLLRGGWLDGRAGWTIAGQNARGTFLRYLWAARKNGG